MGTKITNCSILVTGGAGFIGSHIVQELINHNNRVTVVDIRQKPGSFFKINNLDKKANVQLIDVRNRNKTFSVVKHCKPQYIFHLAAEAIVDRAYLYPLKTLETNIIGTANILEAARTCSRLRCVLVTSSDKAYGKKPGKYREIDPLQGDHPYEVSKSCEDLISYSYFKTYGLPVVVTRFGNVYGEGDINFSRIVPGIMEALVKRKILQLRSDGTYVRDYLYVRDVVDGCLQLVKHPPKTIGQAFNFGSYETLSVIGLITKIEKILHQRVRYKILNNAINEIPSQSLDFSKITKLLSWTPKWSLTSSIPKIFEYYRKTL